MEIVKISQEQADNEEYPLCRRCEFYENAKSSIFGDGWSCSKKHSSVDVDDNSFDLDTLDNLEIHDCGDYKNGEPIVYYLV